MMCHVKRFWVKALSWLIQIPLCRDWHLNSSEVSMWRLLARQELRKSFAFQNLSTVWGFFFLEMLFLVLIRLPSSNLLWSRSHVSWGLPIVKLCDYSANFTSLFTCIDDMWFPMPGKSENSGTFPEALAGMAGTFFTGTLRVLIGRFVWYCIQLAAYHLSHIFQI